MWPPNAVRVCPLQPGKPGVIRQPGASCADGEIDKWKQFGKIYETVAHRKVNVLSLLINGNRKSILDIGCQTKMVCAKAMLLAVETGKKHSHIGCHYPNYPNQLKRLVRKGLPYNQRVSQRFGCVQQTDRLGDPYFMVLK